MKTAMLIKPVAAASVLVLAVGFSATACGGGGESNAAVCQKIKSAGQAEAQQLKGANSSSATSRAASALKDLAGKIRTDVSNAASAGLKSAGNNFAGDIDKLTEDTAKKNKSALVSDFAALTKDEKPLAHYCPQIGNNSTGSSGS